MYMIFQKLDLIQKEVKGWNKSTFGDVFNKKGDRF